MAQSVGVSRREADEIINAGKVAVNGKTAEIGLQVSSDDDVTFNGDILRPKKFEYLLLNKPIGYVCSRAQQDDKPTIYAILPQRFHHLKTAGRLDADSHGLVLLTNDGDYSNQLTHPSTQKTKKYLVNLAHAIADKDVKRLEQGVPLEDGLSILGVEKTQAGLEVTMREGRNRQIRRTFEALGYEVIDLFRTDFGPYSVAGLKDGEYASTSKKDVE